MRSTRTGLGNEIYPDLNGMLLMMLPTTRARTHVRRSTTTRVMCLVKTVVKTVVKTAVKIVVRNGVKFCEKNVRLVKKTSWSDVSYFTMFCCRKRGYIFFTLIHATSFFFTEIFTAFLTAIFTAATG